MEVTRERGPLACLVLVSLLKLRKERRSKQARGCVDEGHSGGSHMCTRNDYGLSYDYGLHMCKPMEVTRGEGPP